MTYRESRAQWRKLWRSVPHNRKVGLSHHAIGTAYRLIAAADDKGCLGPVSDRGHVASLLAQRIGVRPQDRKGFYRDVDELVQYGDDSEPMALVVRDGAYFLTHFREAQANRRQRDNVGTTSCPSDNPGTTSGQPSDNAGTEVSSNPAESHDTETDLGTDDRRKKKEERLSTSTTSEQSNERVEPQDADAVLAYWHAAGLEAFPDVTDDSRRRLIRKRLDAHTADELKAAIDGATRSKLNKRDLPAIFKDAETIERLAAATEQPEPTYGRAVPGADETSLALQLQDEGHPTPWSAARTMISERRRERNAGPERAGNLIDLDTMREGRS